MEWLPIESAPKDGTRILVRTKNGLVQIAHWLDDADFERAYTRPGWQVFACDDIYYSIALEPVHVVYWMPLPSPPKQDEVAK